MAARGPRGDITAALILRAADRLLGANGRVEGISLRAVAAEVGVAANALYTYFPSLDAIWHDLADERLGRLHPQELLEYECPHCALLELAARGETVLSTPGTVSLLRRGPVLGRSSFELSETIMTLTERGSLDPRDAHDLIVQAHVAETKRETDECLQSTGKTPVEVFDSEGLLNERFVGAHGVWLTDSDRQLLARRGAAIAHCPSSNMKLASGIFAEGAARRAGVRFGLGTDGASSNNRYDMFAEMRTAALLAKVSTLDPVACSAADIHRTATVDGFKMFRLDAGEIAVGKPAASSLANVGPEITASGIAVPSASRATSCNRRPVSASSPFVAHTIRASARISGLI